MISMKQLIRPVAIAATFFYGSTTSAQQLSPADQEYFEAKIRPILIDYCYDCHGDGATKGGLDLSTKAGALAGGSAGPAVAPGDPGKSIMIIRMKDLGDPMPPAGKDAVPDELIAELENWIRRGAPDPRTGKSAGVLKSEQDFAKAKEHWGFQKVKEPKVPSADLIFSGKLKGWIKNPIDSYVLEKLEEQEMVPSLPADQWSLLRRVYFDLIGLPPSYEDMQRFTSGQETFEQVVDRLLASPQYGERWGRHWLDVARYADSTGNDNRRGQLARYIYAHTYRDWVIESMNEDKPYNQFLIEQFAADRQKGDHGDLAALGFLTLGPRIAGGDEIIDDRIDVTTRGIMGLSVYCARCHDHKFDPVPTADYYSLYGVFRSSREPNEQDKPILIPNLAKGANGKPAAGSSGSYASNPDYAEFLGKMDKLEKDHEQFRLKEEYEREKESREKAKTYMYWTEMFTKAELRIDRNRGQFERAIEEMQKARNIKVDAKNRIRLKAEVGEAWQRFLSRKREDDAVFGPWKVYANTATNAVGAFIPAELAKAQKKLAPLINPDPKNKRAKRINPIVAQYFKTPPRTLVEAAGRYQAMFDLSVQQWMYANQVYSQHRQAALAKGDDEPKKPTSMEDAQKRFKVAFDKQFGEGYAKNMEGIRRVMFENGHPGNFRFDDLKRRNGGLEREEMERFISKIESLKINHPGSPPRAMVLEDGQLRDEAIMIKGNPRQRGKVVPRQFLEILSGEDRQPFKIGSGRLELAKAIAADDNPLTSRVMVNRVWSHHFGKGLVSSLNEFGLRAMEPTHPELLDYLAWYFVENGWSLKTLHKHIVMSNTYQQTSDDNPRYSVKDPDNLYYYKMDRRRLDFEAFRDGLLHVAGRLDFKMGGKPIRLTGGEANYRRTVYALVDRRNLDEMFKTFDFPSPDSTAGQRFASTVSQQALFMLNSPIVADLSHRIVNRPEFTNIADDRSRITTLYNMIYQRDPEPLEIKLGQRFLQEQTGGVTTGGMANTPTWYNGYGQWGIIDAEKKVYSVSFRRFPFTDGKVWKGNNPAFGQLKLTAQGGHPGPQPNVAVMRRWVAPMNTTVNVSGRLEHRLDDDAQAAFDDKLTDDLRKWYDNNAWDGVTGFIVHSRAGNASGQRFGKEVVRADVRRGRRDLNSGDIQVQTGDTIDFIVTSKGYQAPNTLTSIARQFQLENPQQDNFTWNPKVSMKSEIAEEMKKNAGSLVVSSWTASDEFEGATYKPKPLNAWEKYTQVLLLSNEVVYTD